MKNNSYSLTETKDFYDIFLSVLLLPLVRNAWNVNALESPFFFTFI